MEIRVLLSTVTLDGDSGPTSWYVRRVGENVQIFQNQPLSATPFTTLSAEENDSIDLAGESGYDTVTVDYSGGDPIAGGLTIGESGPTIQDGCNLIITNTGSEQFTLNHNHITIGGSDSTDVINLPAGNRTNLNFISGGGTDQINVQSTSYAYSFNSDLGSGGASVNMDVQSGGKVAFGVTQHLNSLSIDSGGAVTLSPAGGQVLVTNTLTVNGVLNLTNNDLIVNNPSVGGSAMGTLEDAVVNGFNVTNGTITTPLPGSIYSSTAVDDGMTIGVAPVSQLNEPLTSLDGQAVSTNAIVARYTLPGDANLDGVVDGGDLAEVLHNYNYTFGISPPEWYSGDFYYTGTVGSTDLDTVLSYYGSVAAAAPAAVTVGVPYAITLPATTSSGATVVGWDMNWGDGQFDSYTTANATVAGFGSYNASHTYTSVGTTGLALVQITELTSSGLVYHATATALAITDSGGRSAYHLSAGGSDAINIVNSSGGTIISDNGNVVETIPSSSLLSLTITGDTQGTVTVDFSDGDPLPPSGLSTDSQQVDISGSTGSDTLFTTATASVFGNAEIRYPASTALTFLNAGPGDTIAAIAGTVTIDGDSSNSGAGSSNGGPTVAVDQGATALFTGTQHLSALDVLPGGTARMAQYGSYQLVTNSLNLSPYQGPPGDLPAQIDATISGTDSGISDLQWGAGLQTDGYFADLPGGESPGGLKADDVAVYLAPASSGIYYAPAEHGFNLTGFDPGQWVLYIDDPDLYNSWGGNQVVLEQGYNLVGGYFTPVGSSVAVNLTTNSIASGTESFSTSIPTGHTQNGFPSGGLLDLADDDLIVHGGDVNAIAALLANGYDYGYWDNDSNDGTPEPAGIDSTVAVDDASSPNAGPQYAEALGYARIGTGTGDLLKTSFDNQPVSAGDVIVKFTYYGDANLDGSVDSNDLALITSGQGLSGWTNGDFDYASPGDNSSLSIYDAVSAMTLPPGSMTLAGNADFPALPATTPYGTPISSWQVNYGNGVTQTPAPDEAMNNPYPDAAETYIVTLTALDANGDPEYRYPHTTVNVTVAAPTDLTPQGTTSTTATLFWSDPAGGSNYTVQYSTDPSFNTGVSSVSVTAIDQGAESDTDDGYVATVSGLSPNENYYLRVARNEANAPYSTVVGTVTASADGLAAPEKLTQTAYSSSQIDVAWTAYAGIDGAPPWSYLLLEQSADGINFTPVIYSGTSDQIPATVSQLVVNVGSTPGSTFTFRLQAVYSNGELSAPVVPTEVSDADSGLSPDLAPATPTPIDGVRRFAGTNPIDQAGWYYVSISDGTAAAVPTAPSNAPASAPLTSSTSATGLHFTFESSPVESNGVTYVTFVQVDLKLISPRIWARSEMDALTRAFTGTITTYTYILDDNSYTSEYTNEVDWPHSSLVLPYAPGSQPGGVVGISPDAEPADLPPQPPSNAPSGITFYSYSSSDSSPDSVPVDDVAIRLYGGWVFLGIPTGNHKKCNCPTKSTDPVEYSDGVFDYETTDLESDGFGGSFSVTRTMVPTLTDAAVNINGWGMADTSLPYLVQDPGGWSLGVVENGTQQEWFNLSSDGATYSASFDSQSTLAPMGNTFRYQDAQGDQEVFYGFGGGIPANQQGQLESSTDESGNTVSVYYVPGTGDIQDVVVNNINTVGADVYTYAYSGGQIQSIALQETADYGSDPLGPIIRQVVYSYYVPGAPDTYVDGDSPAAGQFGNAGDLKTAEVEDGNGENLGEQYYRYYPHIDGGGQTDRFSYIFTQTAFGRLVSALGGAANVFSASNADVAPYASWALTYDSMDRVSTEDVSGFGASASGTLPNLGIGTFSFTYTPNAALYGTDPASLTDFSSQADTSPYPDVWVNGSDRLLSQGAENSDFNQWVEKTVETLPDGDHNIIYTNAGGRDILSAFVPQTGGPITATYNVYDQQGRLIETAEPSAINLSNLTETPQTGDLGIFISPEDSLLDGANGYDLGGPTSLIDVSSGLVEGTSYTTADISDLLNPNVPAGYPETEFVQQGQDTSTATVTSETVYSLNGSPSIYQPSQVIQPDPQEQDQTTAYTYADSGGSWVTTQMVLAGDSDETGQGSSAEDTSSIDALNDGYTVWTQDAEGIINLSLYDPVTGGLLETIDDVNMSSSNPLLSGIATPGWTNSDGNSALNLVTKYTLDGLGRPLSMTDPDESVTFYAYEDAEHETRVYPGWHLVPGTTDEYTSTGPITVYREDWSNSYTETLSYSADLTQAIPDGTDSISSGTLQSLDRQFLNPAGQVISDEEFFNLGGLAYSTSPTLGTINVNYYLTQYAYDAYGRQYETITPNGSVTEKIYDGQDRLTSLLEGTSASSLVDVADYKYDMDGNLTSLTLYPHATGQPDRVTDYVYDWRDRQVAEVDGVGTAGAVVQYTTYDNLDQPIEQQTFAGNGVNVASLATESPATQPLSQEVLSYDDQGRVYQDSVSVIDQATGDVTSTQTTLSWYDARGDLMATEAPNGLVTEYTYDGDDRLILEEQGSLAVTGTPSWGDVSSDSDLVVLAAVAYAYDGDGNVISTEQSLRDAGDSTTATGPLGTGSTPARTSLTAAYYDAADRLIETAYYGAIGTASISGVVFDDAGGTGTYSGRDLPLVGVTVFIDVAGTGVINPTDPSTTTDSNGDYSFTNLPAGRYEVEVVTPSGYLNLSPIVVTLGSNTAGANVNFPAEVDVTGDGGGTTSGTGSGLGSPALYSPTTAPAASTFGVLVTSYGYDAAGNQNSVTDPNDVTTLNVYDALGRVVSTVDNFISGGPSTNTENVTTSFTYDGDGNMLSKTFYNVRPGGATQTEETQYIYSSPFSNDLLQAVLPPTPSGTGAGQPDISDETVYTYDALGDVLTTTEPNGAVQSTNYNAFGEVISQTTTTTDGRGDPSVIYGYDLLGDVNSVTDAKGYTTNYDYNSIGELLSVEQPDPGDGSGRPTTYYAYDSAGNVTSMTDPMQAVTTYQYDLLNRLTEVIQPSTNGGVTPGPVTMYAYDVGGYADTVTDANQNTTTSVYDSFGRLSATIQPPPSAGAASPITAYGYDYDGNQTSVTDADGNTTSFGYDALDRKTSETQMLGEITRWQYDAAGNVASNTDPLENSTTYYYNTWNQVTEEIQPEPTTGGTGPNAAPTTSFGYDAMGNLTSVTDPDGNVTSYHYNQLNEKTSQTDPTVTIAGTSVTPVTSYLYDLNGNLTQMTDPTGKVTDYTYDHLNRETGEVWKNSAGTTTNTINYTYDKDGRLTGGSDDNSSTILGYNALGELTNDSVTYDGISKTVGLSMGYDADGNNTSLKSTVGGTADLENLYTYDNDNRLSSITQQSQSGGNAVAGKEVVFSYTANGLMNTVTRYAAGSTSGSVVAATTYGYDQDSRLTSTTDALGASGSTSLIDYLGYDADGRVDFESNGAFGAGASSLTTDGAATLGYNNDNELSSVTPGTGSSIDAEAYTYDPAGNRTSAQTGMESSSSTVTPGADNEIASDANYSYTYDADGNLITRTNTANGNVDTYTWDNRNRLVEDQTRTSGGSVIQTLTYTYSPITNQRLSETVVNSSGTTTEYYAYDPTGNLLILLNGSGAVKERDLTGPGLSEILATETGITGNGAGTVEWALTNQVGSVTDVLDNSGTVLDHIRYDSFGNIESQTDSSDAMRFGYAGMQTDSAIGLDYDNARYYDPQTGTFISQDPLSFRGRDYDLYRYTGNGPASAFDPSGMAVSKPGDPLGPGDPFGFGQGPTEISPLSPEERNQLQKEMDANHSARDKSTFLNDNPSPQPGQIISLLATAAPSEPLWTFRPCPINWGAMRPGPYPKTEESDAEKYQDWLDRIHEQAVLASAANAAAWPRADSDSYDQAVDQYNYWNSAMASGMGYTTDDGTSYVPGSPGYDPSRAPASTGAYLTGFADSLTIGYFSGSGLGSSAYSNPAMAPVAQQGQMDGAGLVVNVSVGLLTDGLGGQSESESVNAFNRGCFRAGTLVTSGNGGLQPIEKICLGQRVATPGRADSEPIDPGAYRTVHVQFVRDGQEFKMSFLRPAEVLEGFGAGDTIQLDVFELRVTGPARVLGVESCPPIEGGPGRLVTGMFRSNSVDMRRITLAGLSEPIDITANHAVFSEDHQDFVSARVLQPGGRLRTADGGVADIESNVHLPERCEVFNLEIDGAHQYYVTSLAVLVHNAWDNGLNSNDAVSNFGIYEIEVNDTLHKVGKCDMNRVTQSSGLPTRLHQQVRILEKKYGVGNVIGKIVYPLGQTTTAAAKAAELARLQQIYRETGVVPPGNSKSFSP